MTQAWAITTADGARVEPAVVDAAGQLIPCDRSLLARHPRSVARPAVQNATGDNRLLLAILVILAATAALVVWQDYAAGPVGREMSSRGKVSIRLDPAPPIAPILFDTRNRPLAPESAIEINAKRPPDTTQIPPAQAFRLPSGTAAPGARVTALECLAQAIYYEAASEAEAGQRAVAQVVLNRVRSPVFPNTVCGVVYQGWTRQTGCQFSFTCDGSLQRTPSISGMSRARRIATEALNGSVMRDVGNATHYHANYVVPYWASSLDKVQTVGRHIFYLIRGALGRPAAYNARYAAELEQSPLLVPPAQSIDEDGTPGLVSGPEDPLAAILGGTLAADRAMGTLVTPAGSNILPGDRSSLETNVPTIGASDSGIVRLQADRTGRLEVQASEPSLIADETSGKLVEKDKQP